MKPQMDATHDDLREWDRTHLWHAFTQMAEYEPFIIDRAHGCTIVDIDGREYLDGVSSLWCNVHGHAHPRIDEAVREQLSRVAHTTLLGASNATTVRLCRRLVEVSPPGLNHVFLSDDGSSAIEVALKMAFQYWQQRADPRPRKHWYVAFGDAYHGDTLGSVSVGGVARFHQMFEPLLFHVARAPLPDTYRLPEGVPADETTSWYLGRLEEILARDHERIAALILEPLVQCAAGIRTHPPGFLRGVRELTRKYDVLFIADEVAVGFGRTGKLFACEQEGVSPDFLCLAKGITGGYLPMSATLTTTEVWNAFLGSYAESKTFFHGHTYGGNPLAAAAALANLDLFEEEETLAKLPEKVDRMRSHLARIAEHPHVGDVRQCGMIGGIELVQDRSTKTPYDMAEQRGMRACVEARRHGVFLRPLGNVIVFMPPLAISLEEIDRLAHTAEQGIAVATA